MTIKVHMNNRLVALVLFSSVGSAASAADFYRYTFNGKVTAEDTRGYPELGVQVGQSISGIVDILAAVPGRYDIQTLPVGAGVQTTHRPARSEFSNYDYDNIQTTLFFNNGQAIRVDTYMSSAGSPGFEQFRFTDAPGADGIQIADQQQHYSGPNLIQHDVLIDLPGAGVDALPDRFLQSSQLGGALGAVEPPRTIGNGTFSNILYFRGEFGDLTWKFYDLSVDIQSMTVQAIPEPSVTSFALTGGLLAFASWYRRGRMRRTASNRRLSVGRI